MRITPIILEIIEGDIFYIRFISIEVVHCSNGIFNVATPIPDITTWAEDG